MIPDLSHSPLPGLQLLALAGMAERGCCGMPMAVMEQGWHPGLTDPGGKHCGGGLEQQSLLCFLLQKCGIFWTDEQV